MRRVLVCFSAALLLAGGCATVSTSWQEQVRAYPRIGIGDQKPADGKYVLHLPAGKPVPVKIVLEGSIFTGPAVQEVSATPRRDLYFYKNMVSYDLSDWKSTRAAIGVDFDVEVPSYEKPVPGQIKLILNERAE